MSCPLDYAKLHSNLCLSQSLLYKCYLSELNILPTCCAFPYVNQSIRLVQITDSTCPLELNALASILGAFYSLNLTLVWIMHVTPETTQLYLGVQHPVYATTGAQILVNALKHISPSPTVLCVPLQTQEILLDTLLFNLSQQSAVSVATCLPQVHTPIPYNTSPLDQLSQLMSGESFTMLALATPLSHTNYTSSIQQLQELYTSLYPFRDITHSTTCGTNKNCTETTSCSQNENDNTTHSNACGTSTTQNTNNACNRSLSVTSKPTDPLTLSNNNAINTSTTDTQNATTNTTSSDSKQIACTSSSSTTHGCANTETLVSNSKSFNIQVEQILLHCQRFFSNYPLILADTLYNFSTYFISDTACTSTLASANYIHLFSSSTEPLFPSVINTWQYDSPSFNRIMMDLKSFHHPHFCWQHHEDVTPTLMCKSSALNAFLEMWVLKQTSKTESVQK